MSDRRIETDRLSMVELGIVREYRRLHLARYASVMMLDLEGRTWVLEANFSPPDENQVTALWQREAGTVMHSFDPDGDGSVEVLRLDLDEDFFVVGDAYNQQQICGYALPNIGELEPLRCLIRTLATEFN